VCFYLKSSVWTLSKGRRHQGHLPVGLAVKGVVQVRVPAYFKLIIQEKRAAIAAPKHHDLLTCSLVKLSADIKPQLQATLEEHFRFGR
jgi:hypothetical protein